jgi:hypothetical protein
VSGSLRQPENVVIIRHNFNDGNAENIGNLEKDDKNSLKKAGRTAILEKVCLSGKFCRQAERCGEKYV